MTSTAPAPKIQSPSRLLRLPAEIRNKIWIFAFASTAAIPLSSSLARRTSPPGALRNGAAYDRTCHGCARKPTHADPSTPTISDPHTLPISTAILPLLTCRQIHDEAITLYQNTLHVHACLTSELQLPRACDIASRPCTQYYLRHLSLRIHVGVSRDADIQEDMRHLWLSRLRDLGSRFPALESLHVTAHLRPPVAYENLIDAIYFAGPLCHLPERVKLQLEFDYVDEDIMIDHPELGQIWYSDALGEHVKVIEDCMADEVFRSGFLAEERSLDVMTGRLLEISQEHERPWLVGLRARNAQRVRERMIEEARMNARMNGSR